MEEFFNQLSNLFTSFTKTFEGTCDLWTCFINLFSAFALFSWIYTLYIVFCSPIRRDRYIVKGAIWKVIFLAFSFPFAVYCGVLIYNACHPANRLTAQELAWQSNTYPASYDTIRISKECLFIDNDSNLVFHTTGNSTQEATVRLNVKPTHSSNSDLSFWEDLAQNSTISSDGNSTTRPIEGPIKFVPDSQEFNALLQSLYSENEALGKLLTNEIVSYKSNKDEWIFITKEDILPSHIKPDSPSLLWTILYHFIDPGNQYMVTTTRGRWIVGLVAIFGIIIMTGLMVASLISAFESRRQRWSKGNLLYRSTLRNHIVIIGANSMVTTLVRQLFKESKGNYPYILIQTKRDVEELRLELNSFLPADQERKVVIYHGDRTSKADIANLKIEKATKVYILGEDEHCDQSESYHDSLNIKCLNIIASHISAVANGKKIKCYVMFEHQSTYAIFKFSNISQEIIENIDFMPFNPYEMWAQKVLVKNKTQEVAYRIFERPRDERYASFPWLAKFMQRFLKELPHENLHNREITYTPIDSVGISINDDHRVHMIIVGMTPMGIEMAFETAQIAHYPNFLRDSNLRTTITFIDPNAFREMEFIKGRYPYLFDMSRVRTLDTSIRSNAPLYDLDHSGWTDNMQSPDCAFRHMGGNFLDVQWEFIQGGIESPTVRSYLEQAVCDKSCYTTIAICRELPYQSIASGIYLPPVVLDNALQVLVYQRQLPEVLYNLIDMKSNGQMGACNRFSKLRPFGMFDEAYEEELLNETAPKLVNAFYEDPLFNNNEAEMEASWKKLSIDLKWSNIYFAHSIASKFRSIGHRIDENTNYLSTALAGELEFQKGGVQQKESVTGILAKVEHNRWNMEKLLLNYRALKQDEWNEFIPYITKITAGHELSLADKKELGDKKSRFKKKDKLAHLNLCPYNMLQLSDPDAIDYDIRLIKAMPTIIERSQKQ